MSRARKQLSKQERMNAGMLELAVANGQSCGNAMQAAFKKKRVY
jgi:hypothetical protein